MAIFPCPECEGTVSDKAAACPHCGCPVQLKQCGECAAKVVVSCKICTGCGAPFDDSNTVFSGSAITSQSNSPSPSGSFPPSSSGSSSPTVVQADATPSSRSSEEHLKPTLAIDSELLELARTCVADNTRLNRSGGRLGPGYSYRGKGIEDDTAQPVDPGFSGGSAVVHGPFSLEEGEVVYHETERGSFSLLGWMIANHNLLSIIIIPVIFIMTFLSRKVRHLQQTRKRMASGRNKVIFTNRRVVHVSNGVYIEILLEHYLHGRYGRLGIDQYIAFTDVRMENSIILRHEGSVSDEDFSRALAVTWLINEKFSKKSK